MRVKIIYTITLFVFALVIAGLFWTQIVNHDQYRKLSWTNRVRLVPVEAPRGQIFDRNGIPIVSNRLSFDVVIIPQELKGEADTFSRLGDLFGVDPGVLADRMKREYATPFSPIVLVEDIP
ncbi:MAG: penicillin-binding protein 2, partial [Candidatus Omnitrophota bacterium]